MYWQLVDVEDATVTQSATGAVVQTWATHLASVEARLMPMVVDERLKSWATPEEDAYEVQLRGSHPTLRPRMRVVADGAYYDIRQIVVPPPFYDHATVLHAVRVTP